MEKTTQQLKEALKVAGEETLKCKAAKEVIKSLTAQVGFILMFIVSMHSAFKQLVFEIKIVVSLIFQAHAVIYLDINIPWEMQKKRK